jgi:hypothetical protein
LGAVENSVVEPSMAKHPVEVRLFDVHTTRTNTICFRSMVRSRSK